MRLVIHSKGVQFSYRTPGLVTSVFRTILEFNCTISGIKMKQSVVAKLFVPSFDGAKKGTLGGLGGLRPLTARLWGIGDDDESLGVDQGLKRRPL